MINPCLASYRFSSHDANGVSPFFALHGYEPTLPMDTLLKPRRKYQGSNHEEIYLENLHRAFVYMADRSRQSRQKNQQRQQGKANQVIPFKLGEPVYYLKEKSSKLDISWAPHFRIVKVRGPVSYTIRNDFTGQTIEVHSKKLKRADRDWQVQKQPSHMRKGTLAAPVSDGDSSGNESYGSVVVSDKLGTGSTPKGPNVHFRPHMSVGHDDDSDVSSNVDDNVEDVVHSFHEIDPNVDDSIEVPHEVVDVDHSDGSIEVPHEVVDVDQSDNGDDNAEVAPQASSPEPRPESVVRPKRKYKKRTFPSMRTSPLSLRTRSIAPTEQEAKEKAPVDELTPEPRSVLRSKSDSSSHDDDNVFPGDDNVNDKFVDLLTCLTDIYSHMKKS